MAEYLERETAVMRLMQDGCVYRGGQFVDGIGRGDAMEVKSFWLWLPLPPLPLEVIE